MAILAIRLTWHPDDPLPWCLRSPPQLSPSSAKRQANGYGMSTILPPAWACPLTRLSSSSSDCRTEGQELDQTLRGLANPAPYDRKIALSRHEDNSLNFHLVDSGCKISVGSCFDEPSPAIVEHSSRYVRFGNVRSMNKDVTVKVQREIVRFVIGTH